MASIKVGDKIPEDASFFVLKNDAPATVSAAELFPGKKVIYKEEFGNTVPFVYGDH